MTEYYLVKRKPNTTCKYYNLDTTPVISLIPHPVEGSDSSTEMAEPLYLSSGEESAQTYVTISDTFNENKETVYEFLQRKTKFTIFYSERDGNYYLQNRNTEYGIRNFLIYQMSITTERKNPPYNTLHASSICKKRYLYIYTSFDNHSHIFFLATIHPETGLIMYCEEIEI
jgi:hypothetical protein